MPGESATGMQSDRREPELGGPATPFNMHMSRLCPIARVEEEPVWSYSEDRRHRASSSLANDLPISGPPRRAVRPKKRRRIEDYETAHHGSAGCCSAEFARSRP